MSVFFAMCLAVRDCLAAQVFAFVFRSLVGEDDGFDAFEAVALSPVGLVEDAVNVLVIDGASLGADGFDHGSKAEVFDGA